MSASEDHSHSGLEDQRAERPSTSGYGVPRRVADLIGQRVGSYRIVAHLGEGGMAEVYLAERADRQFEQQVALKLIRSNRATDEAVQRFERERQIVASLDHPNIARLLDGGVSADGRPFFAMEYVDGQPIDRYCDQRKLSIEERLRLFVTVARTVHYAHRNLLVHRDLKPANILVTDDGQLKLLDFGIAKLLDEDPQQVFATQPSSQWMTPEYASPEQLRGETVTTASDQYQLGLLLFELLTGQRPYGPTQEGNWVGLVHAICERQPPRPSAVVSRASTVTEESTQTISTEMTRRGELRTISPQGLRRKLKGDLDAIVLKALRKEPELRYGSTEQMAADVEAYLDELPVAARSDTVGYRSRKFVARHRVSVAMVMAFLLTLVIYAISLTVQSRQLTRERDRAQASASEAAQVKDFLIDLFASADPNASSHGDDELTVRELVGRGTQQIAGRLDQQPKVRAEMLRVLGKVHFQLGSFRQAEPLLQEALDIQRRTTSDDLEIAQALNDLAMVRKSLGEYAEAEALYRQALGLRRRFWGGRHPKISGCLHNLAMVVGIRGRYDEAETLLLEALTMDRAYYGSDHHRDVTFDLSGLSELYLESRRLDKALRYGEQVLELRLALFGGEHLLVARSRHQLAQIHAARSEFGKAKTYLDAAHATHRSILGTEHVWVGRDLALFSRLALARGDLAEAVEHNQRAMQLLRRFVTEEHRLVAQNWAQAGEIERRKGNPQRALELYSQALASLTKIFPEGHPELARVYRQRGQAYAESGEMGAARADWRIAHRLCIDFFGEQHPDSRDLELVLARQTAD